MLESIRRAPVCLALAAALVGVESNSFAASTISLGSRILDLADDVCVARRDHGRDPSVQFGNLTSRTDPTDVQVNVTCDPFSGDVYCALPAGYVTEGNFFAAGAPFNVLTSGIVDLDPVTFAQTGLLFAVDGIYAGGPPAPSGDGVLAFVVVDATRKRRQPHRRERHGRLR